jgi:hypothetical protein
MASLTDDEFDAAQSAIGAFTGRLQATGFAIRVHTDFDAYVAIRRRHGSRHLNQAFDPQHTLFGAGDFWLLAEDGRGDPVATYCLRRLRVEDFYALVRSQRLWFGRFPRPLEVPLDIACQIPAFGGDVVHGGGLWVREDYRGVAKLAGLLPRLGCAIALRDAPIDHECGMILGDPLDPPAIALRKAVFIGRKVYGFARVHPIVNGWFPPEKRHALVSLCHSTRAEAIASLPCPALAPAMLTPVRPASHARLSEPVTDRRADR